MPTEVVTNLGPCGCCGGGGGVGSSCCPGVTVPRTLYWQFSGGADGCECLDGVGGSMTWDATLGQWFFESVYEGCYQGDYQESWIVCDGLDPSGWGTATRYDAIAVRCKWNSRVYPIVWDVASCDPFLLVGTLDLDIYPGTNQCCRGTVVLTVSEDPL